MNRIEPLIVKLSDTPKIHNHYENYIMYFFQIIDKLPDMDIIINTRDWPQVDRRFGTLKPVFSFSKVCFILLYSLYILFHYFFM